MFRALATRFFLAMTLMHGKGAARQLEQQRLSILEDRPVQCLSPCFLCRTIGWCQSQLTGSSYCAQIPLFKQASKPTDVSQQAAASEVKRQKDSCSCYRRINNIQPERGLQPVQ